MMRLAAALTVACVSSGAIAAPVCFTAPEMRALAGVAAGPALTGLASRCAAFPAVAPALTAARPTIAGRFKAQAAAGAPIVGAKLGAFMNLPGADATVTAEAFGPLLGLIVNQMTAKFTASDCRGADVIAATVLPLGDAQIVDLLGAVLVVVARDRTQEFRLCDREAL